MNFKIFDKYIIKDINNILNYDDILIKFNLIMEIYQKMNDNNNNINEIKMNDNYNNIHENKKKELEKEKININKKNFENITKFIKNPKI